MKARKILLATIGVAAASAATAFGLKKLKEHLDKTEILIREADLMEQENREQKYVGGTLIDLYKQSLSNEILEALKLKDDEKFIIVVHRSAYKKLEEMGVDTSFEPPVFDDETKEKFIIFDTSFLNSEDFDIIDRDDFLNNEEEDPNLEDLIDFSNEEIEE